MQEQRDQRRGARTGAVVCQKSILKFVLTYDVLGKFNVKFIFRTKYLDVLWNGWCEVFYCPGPEKLLNL